MELLPTGAAWPSFVGEKRKGPGVLQDFPWAESEFSSTEENMVRKQYGPKALDNLNSECGRPIATVHRDSFGRLYARKSISFAKHALRTPPGIAFDNSALRQAERLGVVYFVVFDRDSKRSYCAEAHLFQQHGFRVARGFAPQTALGMQFWAVGEQPPRGLFDDDQDFGGAGVAA